MKRKFKILYLFMVFVIFVTGCKKITADFEYDCGECKAPCEVTFTNLSENADSYIWDFGDGENSLEHNPVHTYNSAGTFTIKLTAIGDKNDIVQKEITINESDIVTNPLEPNANSLIQSEFLFGSGNDLTSIMLLEKKDDNNFYFYGLVEYKKTIGQISTTGNLVWSKNINFTVNDFYVDFLSGTECVIFVGNTDDLTAVIAVYDGQGNFLDDEVFNEYPKMFFNGIAKSPIDISGHRNEMYFLLYENNVSYWPTMDGLSGTYILVGGLENNSTIYPFIQTITISTFEKGSSFTINKELPVYLENNANPIIYTEYPNMRFSRIEFEYFADCHSSGEGNTLNDWCNFTSGFNCSVGAFISSYSKNAQNEKYKYSVLKFRYNWGMSYNVENCELQNYLFSSQFTNLTSVDIVSNSSVYKTINGLMNLTEGGDLYIVGAIETEVDKATLPSSGLYWTAGLVTKINNNGSIGWQKTINISQFNDMLVDCIVDGEYIYTSGYCSRFETAQNNWLGYGLLSKLNKNTGEIISNNIIGLNTDNSLFNCVDIMSNNIFLSGYKNNSTLNKGLMLKINKTDIK